MMSVAPVASAGTAAGYYSHSDNYYFLGNLQSHWLGEGSRELGLDGPVRSDSLTAVLEGRLPDGGRLGKEINGNHVHRPGHDLTFSAPKSVSILALIGGDKRMVDAHNHAVQVAAGYVEKLISARETKNGVTSIVHTGKMVAAAFTHDTSRNLDPQLHTHLIVANMTELGGKWKALATDYIHDAGFIETVMKMQVTLGKIYRTALREQVEAMGHKVEEVGKHGMWEIRGVPEEVREEYSSRGREVQGAVGAEATLRSRDVAAKDTRRAKVDPSRIRLMERWQTQMKEKGFDLKGYMDSVTQAESDTASLPEQIPSTADVQTRSQPDSTPEKVPARDSIPDAGKVTERDVAREEPSRPVTSTPSVMQTGTHAVSPAAQGAKAGPEKPHIRAEVSDAVRHAISHLSNDKTRFTWGELMLTATEFSDQLPAVAEVKMAIDASLKEGMIVPLDSEKGVFTSRIHLLDELSIQALSQERLKDGKVVSFARPEQYAPRALEAVEKSPLVLMNAPTGVAGIRELTTQLTDISTAHGREVTVLASSAERATSLAKSDTLRDRLISRSHVLSGDFSLKPQGTLIIEGAERLGLKETLVLLGEAREKDAQLVFLDSAGRQANGNAMSVLESAGVERSRRTEPAPGLETEVVSIADKRDRYAALASRFAELSAGSEPVTAVVLGQREQKHLTGLIRDALQNAGQLERDGVTVEARSPVWLDNKTRRMSGTYRAGQVLEDRSDAKTTRHFVIERIHEDTRVLSLIDSDGVLSRMKMSELTADWRLYDSETISISTGEQLIAIAGDREAGLKAKDRLQVIGFSAKGIQVERDGQTMTLPADRPLYVKHAYVAAPGGRDNDTGVVLAALNSRDISARTMNSLAQSGTRAEVFTAETQDRAEARLQRMNSNSSPVQLVRHLSGKDDVSVAISALHDGVKSEAGLAVWRAINDQRGVTFSELTLLAKAAEYHPDIGAVGQHISTMVRQGDLLPVSVRGEPALVARATWEMEKAIIRVIDEGKNTQEQLLEQVDPRLLDGLTGGQKAAARLVLGTTDQFIGIQGYAGVGKTTQVKAVKAAIETLPVAGRPVLSGLAPTHQAVKELKDTGMPAQTAKSFLVEHDQRVNSGEKPDYRERVFLIDESSMIGNQDTAAVYLAIQAGGGRGVSMGDTDQFESVDSGAPFKLVQERSPMDVAIMKEIVRQKDVQLKAAVHDIIDNRIDAAIRRIEAQPAGKIPRMAGATLPDSGIVTTEDAVGDIVRDWTERTPQARQNTLIITQLNADRQAVNAGIHAELAGRGELGEKSITVPVLEKMSHTRHQFNKTAAWQAGMVVKRGDRYQDVVAVDKNGSLVTVRDEDGRLGMVSPRELITADVELFTRSGMTVNAGDELRFTATDRERGQTGNQRFTVQSVNDNGDIVMKGAAGTKIINPAQVRAEQHIDYAWAVTGYGAQGASSEYVIALEGTEGGRKYLASQRAFYISASRAKEHVQIYTDEKSKWVAAMKQPEKEVKTAHDALKPETQRQQAKAIWAMGQPVTKTAIGRAWARHQSMAEHSLTAKIIPATRRFPEPALALPLYDNNGKGAGLALISLIASPEGRLTQGDIRMVATEGASAAVLQRSQTGNTHVVRHLSDALTAVREHPKDGVVWQTGGEKPSAHLMKVSRGVHQEEDAARIRAVSGFVPEITLPVTRDTPEREGEQLFVLQAAEALRRAAEQERAGAVVDTPTPNARDKPESVTLPAEESIILPADLTQARGIQAFTPDSSTLRKLTHDLTGNTGERIPAGLMRDESGTDPERAASELASAAKVVNELAATERDMVRLSAEGDRGRVIEHEEPVHTRTIQKER
nr:conjugative transfer relaxase/helicase TraI [uncultured Enterobacter sp.]